MTDIIYTFNRPLNVNTVFNIVYFSLNIFRIDRRLFQNVDRVVIQTELGDGGGGHCTAFRFDGGKLACDLKVWYEKIFSRKSLPVLG